MKRYLIALGLLLITAPAQADVPCPTNSDRTKEVDKTLWTGAAAGGPRDWMRYLHSPFGCFKKEARALLAPIIPGVVKLAPGAKSPLITDNLKFRVRYYEDRNTEVFGVGQKIGQPGKRLLSIAIDTVIKTPLRVIYTCGGGDSNGPLEGPECQPKSERFYNLALRLEGKYAPYFNIDCDAKRNDGGPVTKCENTTLPYDITEMVITLKLKEDYESLKLP
jgi:hypothetical protein